MHAAALEREAPTEQLILFGLFVCLFETGFLCVALPALELGLELRDLPASVPRVLGLKANATTIREDFFFIVDMR